MTRPENLIITSAEVEDARRLVDIEFSAFQHEHINHVLSYRDRKVAAHVERSVRLYTDALASKHTLKRSRSDSRLEASRPILTTSFKKVTIPESGEIISFAKVEMKRYSIGQLYEPADVGHEREPRMNRDWFALNEQMRRDYVGLFEHCYLGMLATEPRYQHNGAGKMLLQQILAEADDAGVEVYLEATDTARPLYEKHDFETVNEIRFDPADYGLKGLGVERQTVMVRGALRADGVRRAVRPWSSAVTQTRADTLQCMACMWSAQSRGRACVHESWCRDDVGRRSPEGRPIEQTM